MRFYKIPNKIFDYKLSPSAFAIYLLLCNKFYFSENIRIKLATLSAQSGLCVNTVRKALCELHNAGLIVTKNRFKNGRFTTNEYTLNRLLGGFSKIDVCIFKLILKKLGASSLLCYCYVNCCSANGRAFPSYGKISQETGLSRSCCIEKIRLLGGLGLLGKDSYITRFGDFGNNNYYLISLTLRIFLFKLLIILDKLKSKTFSSKGGTNFDKHITDPPRYIKTENRNRFTGILTKCINKAGRIFKHCKNVPKFIVCALKK